MPPITMACRRPLHWYDSNALRAPNKIKNINPYNDIDPPSTRRSIHGRDVPRFIPFNNVVLRHDGVMYCVLSTR
jgi:hypothetical protein